jgi:hypothetical protein
MVNSSSIVAAAAFRCRVLDSKVNESYEIHQVFGTDQTRTHYFELYAQMVDAYNSMWRLWELFGRPELPQINELPNPRTLA